MLNQKEKPRIKCRQSSILIVCQQLFQHRKLAIHCKCPSSSEDRPAHTGDRSVEGFIDIRGIHARIPLKQCSLNHMVHHMTFRHERDLGSGSQADEPVVVVEQHSTSFGIDRSRVSRQHCIEVHRCIARSQQQVERSSLRRQSQLFRMLCKSIDDEVEQAMCIGSFRLEIFSSNHSQGQVPHLQGHTHHGY